MSIYTSKDIKCPKCGKVTKMTIWESLNVSVNPERKKDLLEGKINWFECSECGQKGEVIQSLLYHDQENKFMVLYIPFVYIENESFFQKGGYVDEFTSEGKFQSLKRFEKKIPEKFILPYMKDIQVVFSIGELIRHIIFREKLARYKNKSKSESEETLHP